MTQKPVVEPKKKKKTEKINHQNTQQATKSTFENHKPNEWMKKSRLTTIHTPTFELNWIGELNWTENERWTYQQQNLNIDQSAHTHTHTDTNAQPSMI